MPRTYRIGQIVPSSNITMETEIPAMLRAREGIRDDRFTFHSARMRMKNVTSEELTAMDQESLRCAVELADARVDTMAYACLVGIMAVGPGYHRKSEAKIADAARSAGCQGSVSSSAGSLVTGLKALGVQRIALIAPYMKPLTERVVAYIQAEGLHVVDHLSLEIPDNLAVGERDPMALLKDLDRLEYTDADAVVLSVCVQLPSLPAVSAAQDRIGLPVVSTATCTVYQMLVDLGLDPVVPGAGAILDDCR